VQLGSAFWNFHIKTSKPSSSFKALVPVVKGGIDHFNDGVEIVSSNFKRRRLGHDFVNLPCLDDY
jgi:hypothetical protein